MKHEFSNLFANDEDISGNEDEKFLSKFMAPFIKKTKMPVKKLSLKNIK